MSDTTFDDTAMRPMAVQGTIPQFGLLVMMALALASAASGLSSPMALDAEYQAAPIVLGP